MSDELNGLDDKINVRGFFERILKERQHFDEERDRRLEERFNAQRNAVNKAEERLNESLRGFPEEYARRFEVEQLKESLREADISLANKMAETASLLRESHDKESDRIDIRIKELENLQARLVGLYVTVDKWESTNKAEASARATALLRVDEKFEDYVKRYEVRQREVDLLLAAQKGAAEQAIRAAEEQGRKANRNLGLASLGLGAVVFIANVAPLIVK